MLKMKQSATNERRGGATCSFKQVVYIAMQKEKATEKSRLKN